MKTDLDVLMQAQNIDALLVLGPGQHNPAMVYLTGGGHLTGADLIKRHGEPPVLFHGMMERDEAARTGLPCHSYTEYPWNDLMRGADNNVAEALALRYQKMFADAGVTSGRVAVYGRIEFGPSYAALSALQRRMPDLTLVGFPVDTLLTQAMMTKDTPEVERIRNMGKITTGVVGRVADYLTGHAVRNEILIRPDGEPLTIGHVKRLIDLWLAEAGAENPEGTIFAIGRDAGVPHSTGTATDPLRLGQTLVFDIYPCEAQGGYFYDFTRTWCLGYAPDAALALHENVYAVYRQVVSELKVNALFSQYQLRTCELFEAQGHPTIRQNAAIEEGYIHSLGHGVGLKVHEMPFSGGSASAADALKPGTIFTIEPGLYYPERGLGVRIEDTYWTRPDGTFEALAPFPYDLVLPMK
ncbi:MAG TPA: M24 family metallopeptidase [Anaerolineaceae bacterium]|nr:M24 family metallopeptidase [Anaerolineaceae bacterium]